MADFKIDEQPDLSNLPVSPETSNDSPSSPFRPISLSLSDLRSDEIDIQSDEVWFKILDLLMQNGTDPTASFAVHSDGRISLTIAHEHTSTDSLLMNVDVESAPREFKFWKFGKSSLFGRIDERSSFSSRSRCRPLLLRDGAARSGRVHGVRHRTGLVGVYRRILAGLLGCLVGGVGSCLRLARPVGCEPGSQPLLVQHRCSQASASRSAQFSRSWRQSSVRIRGTGSSSERASRLV